MSPRHRYLVALGSNRRHRRHGAPARVVAAAFAALDAGGLAVIARGPVMASAPIGPSHRTYANSAAIVDTALAPADALDAIKRIERSFGRRPRGRRWSARVLDLDLVLWSGGAFAAPGLTIPHVAFRTRDFVLRPALAIAADWRDPLTGLTVRHLASRLTRARRLP